MLGPRMYQFVAGDRGLWRVERIDAVRGDTLPRASALDVRDAVDGPVPDAAVWSLRGVVSNERYVTRAERERLVACQEGLGRPLATRAALIPVRKSASWWALAQDERRAILEERSRHIAIGLEYLPAVARRLHHGRDLGEPFDFLTWFEYVPEQAQRFEELVQRLRATEEWQHVEREVDVRLVRAS